MRWVWLLLGLLWPVPAFFGAWMLTLPRGERVTGEPPPDFPVVVVIEGKAHLLPWSDRPADCPGPTCTFLVDEPLRASIEARGRDALVLQKRPPSGLDESPQGAEGEWAPEQYREPRHAHVHIADMGDAQRVSTALSDDTSLFDQHHEGWYRATALGVEPERYRVTDGLDFLWTLGVWGGLVVGVWFGLAIASLLRRRTRSPRRPRG